MIERLEGYVRRGEFLHAAREAERLLMVPDLPDAERADIYRLVGRVRYELKDLYTAAKMFELAVQLAFLTRRWDCLGAARAELGATWLSLGHLDSGVEQLRAYLVDLHRYDAAKAYLGHVHFNLGLAHSRRKEHGAAIRHYGEALQWAIDRGQVDFALRTYHNLAWEYVAIGDSDSAGANLDLAESLTERCEPVYRIDQMVGRANQLRCRGEIGAAMALVKEVLNPSRQDTSHNHRGNAAWIAGKVAQALDQLNLARIFMETARYHALEAQDVWVLDRVRELEVDLDGATRSSGWAVD